MRARRYRCGSAAALVAALLALLAASPAASAAPAPVEAASSAAARRALRFWTPARMRRARPLDSPAPRHRQPPARRFDRARGRQRRSRRGSRLRGARRIRSSRGPDGRRDAPERRHLHSKPRGGLYRCSGTSVSAPNLSLVLTAGHCVDSGGRRGHGYTGRWIFVPGYRNGPAPLRRLRRQVAGATTRGWVATGSENVDVGAAVVGRNEKGRRLAAAVGAAGIAFNLKPKPALRRPRLPRRPALRRGNAATLRPDSRSSVTTSESFFAPGPLNLAVDCNVTGGASGGGWTIRATCSTASPTTAPADDRGPITAPTSAARSGRCTSRRRGCDEMPAGSSCGLLTLVGAVRAPAAPAVGRAASAVGVAALRGRRRPQRTSGADGTGLELRSGCLRNRAPLRTALREPRRLHDLGHRLRADRGLWSVSRARFRRRGLGAAAAAQGARTRLGDDVPRPRQG